MAERLRVEGLVKRHGRRTVLEGLSFSVAEGEVLALLGASGSGKTTALHAVAGLDRPDAGTIALDGTTVFGPRAWTPPEKRGVGVVFQGQMLWPHLSVTEHLRFVLNAQGVSRGEQALRISAQLEAVQLTGRDRSIPAQLSGGERQRLALARALVGRPRLLLFDEPCANLDATLKSELLALLAKLRLEQRLTAVYVTHDAREALELSDRIAVLDGGKILQSGTPSELLRAPAGPAVARLLEAGSLLSGTLDAAGGCMTEIGTLETSGLEGRPAGTRGVVYIRPDAVELAEDGALSGTVTRTIPDGAGWVALLNAGSPPLRLRLSQAPETGSRVRFRLRGPATAWLS
ncbi:MAG: ABC transporter ATP-binding protein [Planctomycetes bacterium]|nr:ABC transporter ATP-binding protein [Planctomycetota bacterium]